MNRKMTAIGCLLVVIMVLIGIGLHLICKEKITQDAPTPQPISEEELQNLRDTINTLQANIDYYTEEIERLSKEKEKFKQELKQIIEANDTKIDSIMDGDVNYNIEFLSKYLSESDSVERGHRSSNHSDSTSTD